MEKYVVLVMIFVFAFIIFLKQFREKTFDRRLTLASCVPILLLAAYLVSYDRLEEIIPPKLDIALAISMLGLFLIFLFLKQKMNRATLSILIGLLLEAAAFASIMIFLKMQQIFMFYFAVILLALGTILFLGGLFYRSKSLITRK